MCEFMLISKTISRKKVYVSKWQVSWTVLAFVQQNPNGVWCNISWEKVKRIPTCQMKVIYKHELFKGVLKREMIECEKSQNIIGNKRN